MNSNYLIPELGEKISIERVLLTADTIHCVSGFSGEVNDIDLIEYFQDESIYDNESRSFAYVNKENGQAVSCVSIACSLITVNKGISVSAVLIDKFIVDSRYRHLQYMKCDDVHTLASMIFMDILDWIEEITKTIIGAKYVILYSVKEAHRFYLEKCGMKDFEAFMQRTDDIETDDCIPMYYII